MRHTLQLASIICLLLGGVASADHWHGGGGPVVRDHRGGGGGGGDRVVVRDHRGGPGWHEGHGPVAHERVRVHMSGGRYVFPGGVVRVYHRPVIREHYYNVHMRPAVIVENYDPVPGYMWMSGSWTWGGAEWVWSPGYWAPAAEPAPAPEPVVQGGVGFSAGISIH